MHEGGGNSLKYLKIEWNRTEGSGHKDFKKGGGQAGWRDGCFKKEGGAGTPLQTVNIYTYIYTYLYPYIYIYTYIFYIFIYTYIYII